MYSLFSKQVIENHFPSNISIALYKEVYIGFHKIRYFHFSK